MKNKIIEVELLSQKPKENNTELIICDLDNQIEMLSSYADKIDYLISISSGIISSVLDILWVGEFDLANGRKIAQTKVEELVIKTSKILGCKKNDLTSCVQYLEKNYPIASDGNTPDFGGGLQHHLRDFGHHPSIVGLIFSLLTQFTGLSYGTNTTGSFISVPVPEKSQYCIGQSIDEKIFNGIITWFFHLISDIAGSSNSAGLSGGTGIPGPILSLAKEISTLPFIKEIKVNDNTLSEFLSKLFNGTLFAKYDSQGNIIKESVVKLDFRGELGAIIELGKQSLPVLANEIIVRSFYFIRRLGLEIKDKKINNLKDFNRIEWNNIKPYNNATLTRMITISSGIFTTIDISEAIIRKKYWVSINYVGVGRFACALGSETAGFLKIRKIKEVKKMYKNLNTKIYKKIDNDIYERVGADGNLERFGLNLEQTIILYNIYVQKTLNDIKKTNSIINNKKIVALKNEWLEEWKKHIEIGFSDFVQNPNAKIDWFDLEELSKKIKENNPQKTWFRLVMLEAMLFEPYYAISTEKNKKGEIIVSKKYNLIDKKYDKKIGDEFLQHIFEKEYNKTGYIARLRKSYENIKNNLNEKTKKTIGKVTIGTFITATAVVISIVIAPKIAVLLVGAKFAGLSGAALTSACLAYLGGGAIAAGGLGMAGGTAVIIGGSAILGLGVGTVSGSAYEVIGFRNEKETLIQSAKLIASTKEIFLTDEKDYEYCIYIYNKYVERLEECESSLIKLKLEVDKAKQKEKKRLKEQIKNAEDSIKVMKKAKIYMQKYLK